MTGQMWFPVSIVVPENLFIQKQNKISYNEMSQLLHLGLNRNLRRTRRRDSRAD